MKTYKEDTTNTYQCPHLADPRDWCTEIAPWTVGEYLICHRQRGHEGQHHVYAETGPCFTWTRK